MPISMDEVRHVAKLARLELTEQELASFQGELSDLLSQFQDLQSINVDGLAPRPHAVALTNVWADDNVVPGLSRDVALSNTAKSRAGLFIVPTILEE